MELGKNSCADTALVSFRLQPEVIVQESSLCVRWKRRKLRARILHITVAPFPFLGSGSQTWSQDQQLQHHLEPSRNANAQAQHSAFSKSSLGASLRHTQI